MNPERFHRLRAVLARRQPDLTVLMDRVHKSHNLSAILRNCDAVGVLDVHVVRPPEGLEVHQGSSAGTKKWVGIKRHDDVPSAIASLRGAGLTVVAAHPSKHAVDYRDVDYTVPTALVMGAELYGVSPETLELADVQVVIPMSGMVRSLNVSVATALLLFEARRQRERAGLYDVSRLTPDEFERRLFEWAYPSIALVHRRAGRAYPGLGPDGAILSD
jgi:tRNA (guanosine-2'-O-)-methyltransferase